jgi:hypothetical protein
MTTEELEESAASIHSRRAYIYQIFVSVALFIVSLGQLNDTIDLLSATYDKLTTNFTNQIQYDMLDSLNIGRTSEFIENIYGPPQVVKYSQLQEYVQFQYYDIEKAVIIILTNNARVAGFVVIPTVDHFSPVTPYLQEPIGLTSFSDSSSADNGFFLDANNLVYYAEAQELAKQFLFINRVIGFVEYGMLERTLNDENLATTETREHIIHLNDLVNSGNETLLLEELNQFRQTQSPNFYAYTELTPELIAESLLTRIEFNTYFGKTND